MNKFYIFKFLNKIKKKNRYNLNVDFYLIDSKNKYNYIIILDDILYLCEAFRKEFSLSICLKDDWSYYINNRNKYTFFKNTIKEYVKEELEDKLKNKWFFFDNIDSLKNFIITIEGEKFGGEYVLCLNKKINVSPLNENFLMITSFLSSPDFSLRSKNIEDLFSFHRAMNIIFDTIQLHKNKYKIGLNCKIFQKPFQ